ncbi:MAG: hypothetical protein ACI4IM_03000 [Acutalibacteraceae bacterium]
MVYANFKDYCDLIGEDDILVKKEIEDNLRLASVKIDDMTFRRINGVGFDNLTPFQRDCIRQATCYQAQYIAQNGYDEEDVESYSVGKLSISKGQSGNTASRHHMSPTAYALLRSSGLMFGGA